MDSSDLKQPVRQLVTDGEGTFFEKDYLVPMLTTDEIRVRAIMTGVCRSDIDMMNGKFALLPTDMHGHEGLGEVIAVGNNIEDCKVGDYVATRGEPGYADVYNCKQGTYCVVPEATPEYIIEPVACAVNMIHTCEQELDKRHNGKMLIIGGGFLAKIFYQTLAEMDFEFDIDVWTNTDLDWWNEQGANMSEYRRFAYDIVVDLKDTDQIKRVNVNPNALIILAAQKTVPHMFDFANWLWNNVTIKMPSPRAETFHEAMKWATYAIQTGKIEVDNVWTNSYSRETTWQQAFEHGNDRPQGYGRGYIEWD
jgi:D-arabinose 1-dehydrogenase-like Zn-dependent alcohol dehydrogenase